MTLPSYVSWFWSAAKATTTITVPSFGYSQTDQRENDSRQKTVKSNLVGYLEMDVNWSWSWGGNLGGSLSQSWRLRDSSNSIVYQTGGGGSSGSKSFIITGLDPNETYNIHMTASSSGGSFMVRNAAGNINYTALVQV